MSSLSTMVLEVVTITMVVVMGMLSVNAEKIAKDLYYMDKSGDCYFQGFQDVMRGQVINIHGQSPGSAGRLRDCRLMFQPHTKGDTMKVTLDSRSQVSDPDVEMVVTMGRDMIEFDSNYRLGSRVLETMDGKLTIQLKVPEREVEVNIILEVTALQTIEKNSSSSSGSGDAGLIIGLVVTFVVLIIIIAIIALIFIRKRRAGDRKDGGESTMKNFERVEHHPELESTTASQLSLSYDKRSIDF